MRVFNKLDNINHMLPKMKCSADVAAPDSNDSSFDGGGVLSTISDIATAASNAYQSNQLANAGIYTVGNGPNMQVVRTGAASINWSYVLIAGAALLIFMAGK